MKPINRGMLVPKILVALLLSFCFAGAQAQIDDLHIDSALAALPDVKVIAKVKHLPDRLDYQLTVKQPIDHNNPSIGYFYQQVHLIHRGFDKPVVMETEGYNGRSGGNEVEKMLHCNNLDVEFRFFNKSKPDSLQWQYATFEQATADLHHINQVFHQLYANKWISTGISRGGETTLIYRYFYPDDVALSVPYVAPMPNDIEDKRVYTFQDTAGGAEMVKKIKHFQQFLLQHEAEALAKVPEHEKNLHYTAVGSIGAAFEYAVLEYPFAFWQTTVYTDKDVPTGDNLDDYLAQLKGTFNGHIVGDFSDEDAVNGFLPHAYMTYQMGYYKYRLKPFKAYLHYLSGENPSAAFLPPALPRKEYDPSFDRKVNKWVAEHGNNILYIYGGRDTWTACKMVYSDKVNAKTFIVPGANHYVARVKMMSPQMKQDFAASLESMTGLKPDVSALK
ncbi:hypothetical protein KXD93_01940 [Mucilaginibacter sp. BJC16-A38]|uniref:S28 family serine protease n=1 Tax=Mucilaginibacter phenanthrenivorans TaxID=1234842 RepID=UPI002156FF64|nr:S28 family serine protease [Mucilaginibacter phenanthrenivorans]MCR8556381.1 hypothetical protein [Mucilaginibacter phenanthrenivorans]